MLSDTGRVRSVVSANSGLWTNSALRTNTVLRALWRISALVTLLLFAAVESIWSRYIQHRWSPADRSAWVQRSAKRLLGALKVSLVVHGKVPPLGLLVGNHLSYLDILALGAAAPASFVSKSEVRGWPLLGYLATTGGTLYVDRSRPSTVRSVNDGIEERLRQGERVMLFPEGTTTDGSGLLPFRAPVFRAAALANAPVWPFSIRYSCPGHDLVTEVYYWGEMTLATHLLHLATLNSIGIDIHFADTAIQSEDARYLAAEAYNCVEELLQSSSVDEAKDVHPVNK